MVPAASVGGISGSDLYETGELLLEGNQINPQGVCTFQNMTGKIGLSIVLYYNRGKCNMPVLLACLYCYALPLLG